MKLVMILDDSSVIRKVARRILENMGCNVVDTADGHEALHMCRGRMPDAIIIDWLMPGMSGIEFIQEFKHTFGEGASETALIYCTYEMDLSSMTQAKRTGATHFIMKPFDQHVVEKKLAEAGIGKQSQAA